MEDSCPHWGRDLHLPRVLKGGVTSSSAFPGTLDFDGGAKGVLGTHFFSPKELWFLGC